MTPYHFISKLLNANSDFDITIANDVAINTVKRALSGKLMRVSPCPEVRTLTNENGLYVMKLNYYDIIKNLGKKVGLGWWLILKPNGQCDFAHICDLLY